MNEQETSLQSLVKIEYFICQLPYDSLSGYLLGVRDMINLINREEPNADIANRILGQVARWKAKHELPF